MKTSSKKALAKNAILIAISKVSTQLITFLMLPLYTSLLSTEEYGTVDLIITYATLFAPLIMLNMELAVFRYLVDARNDKKSRERVITNAVEVILLSSTVAAVIYVITSLFFSIPMAVVMALYFFSISFSGVIVQVVRGLGNIKAFAIGSIAQGLLSVVLNIIFLAVFKMGPTGMLLGLALGALVPALVLAFIIKLPKNIKLSARDKATKKELLRYSLPLIPNSISWWIFNASDRTIISVIISTAANGIYAVSNKFSGVLNSLWGIFYMSWSESSALNIKSPDRDNFFSSIANMTIKVFGALAIMGTVLTPLAFPLLANADYNEALLYVPILMLAGFFNVVVGFYSAIYAAKKLTKQVMNTSVIAAVINIVVHFGLIYFVGLWAAAISTAVAYGVMAIFRHYDMKKYVKITYQKGIFVKILGLFTVICALYYQNTLWANLTGLVIAIIASIWLNYGLIKKLLSGGKSFLLSHAISGSKKSKK